MTRETFATASRYLMVPGLSETDSKLVYNNNWTMQKPLLTLSCRSRRIIAENSGHNIQLEQPGLVIDVIQSVLGP